MDTPLKTVFYSIERAIKEYRKFAQRNLSRIDKDITVDQALILMILDQDDSLSLRELARLLFRDNASITRTVQLMVKNGFIRKKPRDDDRRLMQLTLSAKGKELLARITPVVLENRQRALQSIDNSNLAELVGTLDNIYHNCLDDNEFAQKEKP